MPDLAAPILVPSSLANLRWILDDLIGAPSEFLLASVWSFARFDPRWPPLPEFDLPVAWSRVTERVAAFAGVELTAFDSDPAALAYARLDLGQPVVLAVDSYYLPYRPAYRRVHSARTIVAKRIDRAAGTIEVIDSWLPAYAGPLRIADLDRARESAVLKDPLREPLYAGVSVNRRWWTVAIAQDASTRETDGALAATAILVGEARQPGMSSCDGLAQFRAAAAAALETAPGRTSRMVRRAAALHLRGEIGLRAYLLALLRRAAQLTGDAMLAAETTRWALHLEMLAVARDTLIKSVGFDRPEYRVIVDRSLGEALGRERRFLEFLEAFCARGPEFGLTRGQARC